MCYSFCRCGDLLPLSPPRVFPLFTLNTFSLASPCFSIISPSFLHCFSIISPSFLLHFSIVSPSFLHCFSFISPLFLLHFSIVSPSFLHHFSIISPSFLHVSPCFSLVSLPMSLISILIAIALNHTCLIWKVLSPTIAPPRT